MKVTITNDDQYPIKIMQRVPYGHGVDELNSESTEFSEVFIQPGESLQVEGWYRAVVMEPNTNPNPGDDLMYAGGE